MDVCWKVGDHSLSSWKGQSCCCRPYQAECTGSHSNSEVKQLQAWLVLRWGTAWEVHVPTALFYFYSSSGASRSPILFLLCSLHFYLALSTSQTSLFESEKSLNVFPSSKKKRLLSLKLVGSGGHVCGRWGAGRIPGELVIQKLELNRKQMQTKVKKTPAAFLRNTYDILMKGEFESIVSWAQGGTAFVIKDLPRFELEILPKYFKHRKFSSFVRQLNMYGFHKHRYSEHQNTFMHDKFRRDEDRLVEIRRKPETKKKSKQAKSQQLILKMDKSNISVEQIADSQEQSPEESASSEQKQQRSESVVAPSSLNDVCRSSNQFTAQDECCMKLCELLVVQNRILAKKQFDFRNTVLNYKKKDIALQKESISTIEKLTMNEVDQVNPEESGRVTLINDNMRRLDQRLHEQIDYLARFTAEMEALTKELVNTNYSMFSTTSIEEGYSNMRIEEGNRN